MTHRIIVTMDVESHRPNSDDLAIDVAHAFADLFGKGKVVANVAIVVLNPETYSRPSQDAMQMACDAAIYVVEDHLRTRIVEGP